MNEANETAAPVEEWAIVELMGHRQHAGRVSEVARYGTVMLRIDIPVDGTFVTKYAGGSTIYALTPVTEDVARAAAARMADPRPTIPAGFRPAQLSHHAASEDDDEPY